MACNVQRMERLDVGCLGRRLGMSSVNIEHQWCHAPPSLRHPRKPRRKRLYLLNIPGTPNDGVVKRPTVV